MFICTWFRGQATFSETRLWVQPKWSSNAETMGTTRAEFKGQGETTMLRDLRMPPPYRNKHREQERTYTCRQSPKPGQKDICKKLFQLSSRARSVSFVCLERSVHFSCRIRRHRNWTGPGPPVWWSPGTDLKSGRKQKALGAPT